MAELKKVDRVSVTVSIRRDLAERLEHEADERLVGKGLLVERALDGFLDSLPIVLPAQVDITDQPAPGAPTE